MPLASKLFSGVQRLELCLNDHAHNIKQGEKGEHVKLIQQGLKNVDGSDIVDDSSFGPLTGDAVFEFKTTHHILGPGQVKADRVVGRGTMAKLDEMQVEFERHAKPLPVPLPPAGLANVMVAKLDRGTEILTSYYQNCGLETIGPARITTGQPKICATLEDMIDTMILDPHFHQIIVCHGDPVDGLHIRICPETHQRKSHSTVAFLSAVADTLVKKPVIPPTDPDHSMVAGAMKELAVKEDVVLRLARKLNILRRKTYVLHFRACNLSITNTVEDYKFAFGPKMITFHGCRLLFCNMRPAQAKKRVSLLTLKFRETSKVRTRISVDLVGKLRPIGVSITDIDGHTRIEPTCIFQVLNLEHLNGWIKWLIDRWTADPHTFVVPIMWEDSEMTFHYPNEPGWIRKLQFL